MCATLPLYNPNRAQVTRSPSAILDVLVDCVCVTGQHVLSQTNATQSQLRLGLLTLETSMYLPSSSTRIFPTFPVVLSIFTGFMHS